MDVTSLAEAKELLYGHPVGSFIEERNDLVKAVRSAGNRDLANEIKTLRKPSAVAAEVNEVVRADPSGVDLILQAAELLRAAQSGALDGSDIDASALQKQYRAAIQALAQCAPSRPVEVRAALEAATIDEASNEDLRMGCLVAVPVPVSIFGVPDVLSTVDVEEGEGAEPNKTGDDDVEEDGPQPVDELEERRAKRQAKKDAEANKQNADKAKLAAAKAKARAAAEAKEAKAAAAAAAAARAEAAEQKRLEQERRRQIKELKAAHRQAVRAHLAALDVEAEAGSTVDEADAQIADLDDEVQAREQEIEELRVRRSQAVEDRDTHQQVLAESHQAVAAAQAEVDCLADQLGALES